MYGSVTQGGRGVPRAHILVQCLGGPSEGDTIGDGSFRLNVVPEGKCTFTLPAYPGASANVSSYGNPTHYDFQLVALPGGRYELRVQ
jgi:hypothetical protein